MTKFNVGDKVRVTSKHEDVPYNTVLTVKSGPEGPSGGGNYYFFENNEVILGKDLERINAKPKKSERIGALETEVAVLKAEVEALKQAKTTTVHNVSINADSFSITKEIERLANAYPPTKSANERRADVIKRAKAFTLRQQPLGGRRVEYVVNVEKRTVVALVYKVSFGFKNGIHAKGIAKCDSNDVFNADIGKAIALARALGVDVPTEFVKAVQPTEKVVGQYVTYKGYRVNLRPKGQLYNFRDGTAAYSSYVAVNSVITDDTDAVYGMEVK